MRPSPHGRPPARSWLGARSKRLVVPATGFTVALLAGAFLSPRLLASHDPPGRRSAPAATSFTGTPPPPLPAALDIRRLVPLSDPTGATRWAPVLHATVARSKPTVHSAPVGPLPARTPDGTTNVVVADGESDSGGAPWVHVSLAVLPNGTEGWVPRSALGGWSFVETRLVIDRARLTATLLRAGHVVFRARVGVGAPATPTPPGTFYVRDRLSGFTNPMYGPLAFGTNARSPTLTDWPGGGVVGIHGTDQPNLIPGRVSHGCVRLTNAAILRLGKLMPIGTRVTIQ
jgi:L,D-transpeptidase catalytic domain